jgi:hypothetical protein
VVAKQLAQEFAQEFRRIGQTRGLRPHNVRELALEFVGPTGLHHLVHIFYALAQHTVRLAFLHFKGSDLIGDVEEQVAEVHAVEHADEEVDVEVQPRL